jgi:hypothetical protein
MESVAGDGTSEKRKEITDQSELPHRWTARLHG